MKQSSKGEKKVAPAASGEEGKGDADESSPRETSMQDTSTKSLPDADGCRSFSDRSSSPLDVTSSHVDVVSEQHEKLLSRETSVGEFFILIS